MALVGILFKDNNNKTADSIESDQIARTCRLILLCTICKINSQRLLSELLLHI